MARTASGESARIANFPRLIAEALPSQRMPPGRPPKHIVSLSQHIARKRIERQAESRNEVVFTESAQTTAQKEVAELTSTLEILSRAWNDVHVKLNLAKGRLQQAQERRFT